LSNPTKKNNSVTEEIKYLVFKGIEKKEQIVLKSFLNLAKNELKYQLIVLKENDSSGNEPSVMIVGDGYEFSSEEESLKSLPKIILGDDLSNEWDGYITRPIQWSDFRPALGQFSAPTSELSQEQSSTDSPALELVSEAELDEDGLTAEERVLPAEVMFAIDEVEDESTLAEESDDFEPIDHEFELDNMSVDYASHTNSEYMKVVDDVQQFNADDDSAPGAMLLVTDDESSSVNSVLVIETNSLDAWDFSETESSEVAADSKAAIEDVSINIADSLEAEEESEVDRPAMKQKSGFELKSDEEYWKEDNEIIAGNSTILYVKHQRDMVYSESEPGKWLSQLQGAELSKLPLNADWRPRKGLTAYPLPQLVWVNTLMTKTDALTDGLEDDELYILEEWPHFDLLQLDNALLKLCSMLFVTPESLNTLAEKSDYSRSTIRGLMNACYESGILKKADEVAMETLVAAEGGDSVFGKIKGVFR